MKDRQTRFGIQLKRQASTKGLICLLALLCIGIVVRTAMAFYQSQQINGVVTQSVELLESQNDKAEEYLQAYSKKVEVLKEKGIFCLEKKPESPPQVAGILGDSALLNGKWCKVGEENAGAKIIKIEPTEVTILWKENEMKLAPLFGSRPPEPVAEVRKTEIKKADEAPQSVVKTQPTENTEPAVVPVQEEDPLSWLGMDIPDNTRAFILKMFELMPADQVEEAKKEWAEMSDEKKREAINDLQEMIDSGQSESILQEMQAQGR